MVNVIDELPREWAVNSRNVHLDEKPTERRRGEDLPVTRGFQNEQLCEVLRDGLAEVRLRL